MGAAVVGGVAAELVVGTAAGAVVTVGTLVLACVTVVAACSDEPHPPATTASTASRTTDR